MSDWEEIEKGIKKANLWKNTNKVASIIVNSTGQRICLMTEEQFDFLKIKTIYDASLQKSEVKD